MMLKPVCMKCHLFFRPKKNGFVFTEGKPRHLYGKPARPGLEQPECWDPYKLWSGDLWVCRGCKTEIVVGVGLKPVAEDYHKDFKVTIEAFKATFQVNDC